MKTSPRSEAKTNPSGLMENARARDEDLAVAQNGYLVTVPVRAEEFDSWRETVALRAEFWG